ncbi:MAG TPA: ABC transporter permease [Anaerolineae bacterium]
MATGAEARDGTGRKRPLRLSTGLTLTVAFVIMSVIFIILTPDFASLANIKNILRTVSVVGVVAIGETLVLLAGGVDISVGSVAAMSGVIASLLWGTKSVNIWVCALAALLVGGLVGLINGTVITRLKINPLITTLGTYSVVRGLSFALTNSSMNQLVQPDFQFIGRGEVAGIPFSLLLMLALYAIFIFALAQVRAGRNLYAVGGNPVAGRLAGLPVGAYLLTVYVVCGVFAALGGLILASQLAAGTPQAAAGLEFKVIAAVILGGTSLSGGKGTMFGTLVGVFILRTLDSGLILTGVSSYWQEVARGAVLLLAVGFDQLRIRLERR